MQYGVVKNKKCCSTKCPYNACIGTVLWAGISDINVAYRTTELMNEKYKRNNCECLVEVVRVR